MVLISRRTRLRCSVFGDSSVVPVKIGLLRFYQSNPFY